MLRYPAISMLVLSLGAAACGDDAASETARDAGHPTPDAGDHDGHGSRPDAGHGGGKDGGMTPTARIEQACEVLVTCGAVPGAPLEPERCRSKVSDACVDCVIERAEATSDEDAGADGCARARDGSCDQACLELVAPPADAEQCHDIVAGSTSDPACLCEHCLDVFADCVSDGHCLRVADCCGRAGQFGTGCFFVPECMGVILELGPTSVSTALATQVGVCVTEHACGPAN
jgi:hypothetical protein